jgi:hypothetical protein
MEPYFAQFGIAVEDIAALAPAAFANLPGETARITRRHINEIIAELPPGDEALAHALGAMLTPISSLNFNGILTQDIYRMVQYDWRDADMLRNIETLKGAAFVLRTGREGLVHDDLVLAEPKRMVAGLAGCSCEIGPRGFMGKPFVNSYPIDTFINLGPMYFRARIEEIKRLSGHPGSRIAVALELATGEDMPAGIWIVDHDQAGNANHVTIAVGDIDGVRVEHFENKMNKFTIPDLVNKKWNLYPLMFVCEAKAEWRDDYFPGADGWKDAVAAFDLILQYGNFDEYMDIWRVHGMLHGSADYGNNGDGEQDMTLPLQLALEAIESYLGSDACDHNDANKVFHDAISFLEERLGRDCGHRDEAL